MSRNNQGKVWIVTAILLAMMLTALDMTIVGTAMPSIITSLHGVALYSWVFSAYLLTSTTPVPIYSKLADMYGRKPVFLVGASLFTVGSALCGTSVSMPQLVLFRALQGLGAAGVLPVALTIVGDIFTVEQRARVQGLFSAVWGLAAVLGPLAGAWIVENTSWRWVFDINLPVGVLVLIIVYRTFHEVVERQPHRVDFMGSLLMSVGVAVGMIALLQTSWPVLWRVATGLFGIAILGGFVVWENRVPEPIMPLAIFRNRMIGLTTLINLAAGMLMFGLISYLPLYVQVVKGGSPTMAGQAITPMMLAWPITAFAVSPLIIRFGYRPIAIIGGTMITVGAAGTAYSLTTSPVLVGLSMALIGGGMGLSLTGLLIALQSAVPWNLRGVVTGSTQFFRTIGGAIGVAVLGSLFNQQTATKVAASPLVHHIPFSRVTTLLVVPSLRHHLAAPLRHAMIGIMSSSMQSVFILAVGFAAVVLIAVLGLPAHRMHTSTEPAIDEAL